jgi:WXG100 family type VII secretion target
MTKIVVDINALANYSTQMGDFAVEFDNITKNMRSIVSALENGWQGADATNFISNATTYINNLSTVRQALANSSDTVVKQVRAYNQRISDAYTRLGGNENE